METVLVQVPSPDGGPPSQVMHVRPGETLRFGRGARDREVDVALEHDGVSRLAGEISAVEDYWLISNLSADKTYVVDNPEGGGEYVTVAPRRIAAPVPFEFARVSLPVTDGPVEFLVFAPQHAYAEPQPGPERADAGADAPDGERTAAAFPLDETASTSSSSSPCASRDCATARPSSCRRPARSSRGCADTPAAATSRAQPSTTASTTSRSRSCASRSRGPAPTSGWSTSARRSRRSRCDSASCATSTGACCRRGPELVLVTVPPGYRAGGWKVAERIASGTWASVYAARRVQPPRAPGDPPRGAAGALKFLRSGALSPPQYAGLQQAISEEVRFSEQADHPRLIRTFETFVVDDPATPELHGSVVLAMERAERSVQDVLATVERAEAERIVAEICDALAHMHAAGWVHGDLKPGNVLLMADGSVRLADFGLARELDGTHAYAPRVGSSDYLPPEWWTERISEQGVAVRTTADVWASAGRPRRARASAGRRRRTGAPASLARRAGAPPDRAAAPS